MRFATTSEKSHVVDVADEELAERLGDDPRAWGDSEWEQFQNESAA